MRSRQVALAALFASVYAVGVVVLTPISFEVFQVRLADMLLPLSIIFGVPAVIGLSIGTIVGNLASPFGIIDIVGGAIANCIATYAAWKITKHWRFFGSHLIATLAETVIITFIVGSYLQFLLQIPNTSILGFTVPGIVITWLGVLIGSLISINIAGYALLKAIQLRMPKIEDTRNHSDDQ